MTEEFLEKQVLVGQKVLLYYLKLFPGKLCFRWVGPSKTNAFPYSAVGIHSPSIDKSSKVNGYHLKPF